MLDKVKGTTFDTSTQQIITRFSPRSTFHIRTQTYSPNCQFLHYFLTPTFEKEKLFASQPCRTTSNTSAQVNYTFFFSINISHSYTNRLSRLISFTIFSHRHYNRKDYLPLNPAEQHLILLHKFITHSSSRSTFHTRTEADSPDCQCHHSFLSPTLKKERCTCLSTLLHARPRPSPRRQSCLAKNNINTTCPSQVSLEANVLPATLHFPAFGTHTLDCLKRPHWLSNIATKIQYAFLDGRIKFSSSLFENNIAVTVLYNFFTTLNILTCSL